MKEISTYRAEDGKVFDSREACEAYEHMEGFAGVVAEYLDQAGIDGRTRTTQRKALVAFVRWQQNRNARSHAPAPSSEAAD